MIKVGESGKLLRRQTLRFYGFTMETFDLLDVDKCALSFDPHPAFGSGDPDGRVPELAPRRFEEPLSYGQKLDDSFGLLLTRIFADNKLDPGPAIVDREHRHTAKVDVAIVSFGDFDQRRTLAEAMGG